ncbi:hypothetical protein [Aneurinibacillus tyrosinisolvens]|uniref:hypothetical protein n=1 Tax=Aneurinibacillus tyrosinisolvens TaxID=1443435 RepID=UPI00063EE546|nr:hypothetical protein [Aneurinibacillus tyrosinisolvens]
MKANNIVPVVVKFFKRKEVQAAAIQIGKFAWSLHCLAQGVPDQSVLFDDMDVVNAIDVMNFMLDAAESKQLGEKVISIIKKLRKNPKGRQ